MGLFSRDPDDDDDEGGGLFESRTFVLSAIVIGAIVVCGVAILLVNRDSGSPSANPSNTPTESVITPPPTDEPTGDPATPDPTESTPTKRPTKPPEGPPPCRRPATEEGLSEAPAGVSWDFEDGMLVPYRDTLGAGLSYDDGVKYCFHHSPAGAVVASLTTLAQAQDPRHIISVVQRRVLPGVGQRLALAEARRSLASPTPDPDRNTIGQGQYVGYKVVDYTPTRAILNIALQVDPDHIGGITTAVVWSGGDWKIQLRGDGQLGPDPDVLASLDGYVRFRGA